MAEEDRLDPEAVLLRKPQAEGYRGDVRVPRSDREPETCQHAGEIRKGVEKTLQNKHGWTESEVKRHLSETAASLGLASSRCSLRYCACVRARYHTRPRSIVGMRNPRPVCEGDEKMNETAKKSGTPNRGHGGRPPVIAPPKHVQQLADQIFDLHVKHAHINYNRLLRMIQTNSIITHIKYTGKDYTNVIRLLRARTCVGCLKGKHSRLPMTGTFQHHTSAVLDMWLVDTMVPNYPTREGNKYITLIMDMHSGYLICILTKNKRDITTCVINMIKQYQTQKQKTIKLLHSDNASELVNKTMDEFLTSQGTRHTTSMPYTPAHNPIERQNRTIIESTKSMMIHAGAPPYLYGYAADTAVFLRNRSINTHSQTMTAHQQMTGIKPDLRHLHVWGCDAYYYTHKHKREHKFAPNCNVGIFIGYDDDNERYYLILNVDQDTIIRSRDVTFRDHEFTEMKRLYTRTQSEHIRTTSTNRHTRTFSIEDYLPDSIFTPDKVTAVADMFGGDETRVTTLSAQAHTRVSEQAIDHGMTHSPTGMTHTPTGTTHTPMNLPGMTHTPTGTTHTPMNLPGMTHTPTGMTHSPMSTSAHTDELHVQTRQQDVTDKQNQLSTSSSTTQPLVPSSPPPPSSPPLSTLPLSTPPSPPAGTRRSSRVTARPFRHDPAAYATAALDEPLTYKQAITSQTVTSGV